MMECSAAHISAVCGSPLQTRAETVFLEMVSEERPSPEGITNEEFTMMSITRGGRLFAITKANPSEVMHTDTARHARGMISTSQLLYSSASRAKSFSTSVSTAVWRNWVRKAGCDSDEQFRLARVGATKWSIDL